MERLTERASRRVRVKAVGKHACAWECVDHDTCTTCPVHFALARLAAYEDTGLTPEEVMQWAEADRAGSLVILSDCEGCVHKGDWQYCSGCIHRPTDNNDCYESAPKEQEETSSEP